MDDLSLLSAVRATEPGPSAAETAAARDALLAAIDASGRPSRAGARPGFVAGLAARRRIWIPGIAAAAVVTGLVLLTVTSGGSPSVVSKAPAPVRASVPAPRSSAHATGSTAPVYRHATVTAAFVLSRAAAAAAREDKGDGRYFFSESEWVSSYSTNSDPQMYRQGPSLRRIWLGNRVAGRLVWAVGGGSTSLPAGDDPDGLSWAQIRTLPTAQAPLLADVANLAANQQSPKYPNSLTYSEFGAVSQLLFESPTPPAVQAALYRITARLPGIKVTDTTDLVGRHAIEVYREPGPSDPPGFGYALYFDPSTFQLLDEAQISPAGVQCPVLSSYAILATGYVNSKFQLPAGTPASLEHANYSNRVAGCPTVAVPTQ